MKRGISEHLGESQVEQRAALDWLVDKVYVIERKGFHDRFKIVGAIELRKG